MISKEKKNTLHIASCSFGKDSLATILLALEHGEPLDEAVYCEVMFDKRTSGEVPEHRDFIYGTAIPALERMGVKIRVLRGLQTYVGLFTGRITRGPKKGLLRSFPICGRCAVQRDCKLKPILRYQKSLPPDTVQYIGIARDEAFCFYYQENLKLFESLGAEFAEFDPMRDEHLPPGIAGLMFGGGYPELYAGELSANRPILQEIRNAAAGGMPILAECGGFLYLHEELETKEGEVFPMAGVISGRAYPTGKLSRFGYIELVPYGDTPLLKEGERIRGHEFHYWDSTACGTDMKAVKPGGKRSWDCIHANGGFLAGFPHLYYPSNPSAAERWLELCRKGTE